MKSASSLMGNIELVPPMEILKRCNGYYSCPKDGDGKRLGPLVGYAEKYKDDTGEKKQFVGDIYANFGAAEEFPHVMRHYAEAMKTINMGRILEEIDVFCGAPIGGYSFADALGLAFDRRAIKAEKKVIAVATSDQREESELVFARHQVKPGEGVVIVEDVCNNFSTTEQLIGLVKKSGGRVVAIVCLLNRSLSVDYSYTPSGSELGIPVISLVRQPIIEYRQDDPGVQADVLAGNVVWKPKNEWQKLMDAMAR